MTKNLIKGILSDERNDNCGMRMLKLAKKLFPLNRSIMGPDIRLSFKEFMRLNPEFKIIKFLTGEKIFDWEIPEEWIIRDAYLEHESGKRFGEYKKSNLHIMGYSRPVNKVIGKKDLQRKVHSLPDLPHAIPYVTSYYKKDWSFCLSHDELESLPDGNYKAFIDSEYKKGELQIIEALIPGKSKKEIFFSSYLCHPSLANNELSGPVLLNEILNYVKQMKNRHYSYRFVLLPETIGSIAYLSRNLNSLKSNMICGYNLTCVGDERSYSHISSRIGDNIADQALKAALKRLNNVFYYDFIERGSDERQYCAPGVDLPMCTFCRTKFGEYPEYHTSDDNFKVVTEKGLKGSFNVMRDIIEAFEIGIYPSMKVLCEPQLGKRNLYPNTSNIALDIAKAEKNKKDHYEGQHPAFNRMNIIAYCDAFNSVFNISEKLDINLGSILEEVKVLRDHDLIELKHF